jgi:hypothetical protein
MVEHLKSFMIELSHELGLEKPLSPIMPGVYALPIEEDITITVSENPEGISFTSTFGKCPTIRREEFLTQMMEANLFGQGTDGTVLGLSEDGQKMTLSYQISGEDIAYDHFSDKIEDFITVMDFWRDEALNYK